MTNKWRKRIAWTVLIGNALFAWFFMFWAFHHLLPDVTEVWWSFPLGTLICCYTALSVVLFFGTVIDPKSAECFNDIWTKDQSQ